MRPDSSQGEAAVALPVRGREAAAPYLRGFPLRGRIALRVPRALSTERAGRLALGSTLLLAITVVLFSTASPSVLVPGSTTTFPSWFSGPLHGLFGHLVNDPLGLSIGLTVAIVALFLAYGVVLASIRFLSMRAIVGVIVAANVIMLLGPPLQLTDVFNYIGYARLGALHHLNPYTHGLSQASHDPVFRFSSWHDLRSPYGPLFTALSYPLAFLPIPVAYWVLKLVTVLAGLSLTAIVWGCARRLGRDPRFAVAFVALNPLVLVYSVGGFHNEYFMLIPAIGAILLLLDRRDRWAGAAIAVAIAVKFTAVLLLPFLLIAARPAKRRSQVLIGAALAALPLVAIDLILFGQSLPNLSDQSTLLTDFSIPNLVGLLAGVGGGAPPLLRVANVLVVVAVAWLIRRRRDWLAGAGWSTLALLASLAWLVPWYITWLLPFAALGADVRLRRATLAFAVFLGLSFVPATGIVLSHLHLNPMGGSAGQASQVRQKLLEK